MTAHSISALIVSIVAGLLLAVEADVVNIPINQSVIFLNQGNLVFTSGTWRVLIQISLSPYEEAIAALHEEVAGIRNVTSPSMNSDEVQRVEAVLISLENKLTNVKQVLPKSERRRGLFNFGGSMLKVLFGTTTMADLNELHAAVDALSKNQEMITHSANQQITLIKKS